MLPLPVRCLQKVPRRCILLLGLEDSSLADRIVFFFLSVFSIMAFSDLQHQFDDMDSAFHTH